MAFRLSVAVSVFRRSCSSYRIVPGSRLSVVEESWQRRHITCALVLFPSAFKGPFRSWHSGQTWVKPNLYRWGGRVRSFISKGVGPKDFKLSVPLMTFSLMERSYNIGKQVGKSFIVKSFLSCNLCNLQMYDIQIPCISKHYNSAKIDIYRMISPMHFCKCYLSDSEFRL